MGLVSVLGQGSQNNPSVREAGFLSWSVSTQGQPSLGESEKGLEEVPEKGRQVGEEALEVLAIPWAALYNRWETLAVIMSGLLVLPV